MNPSWTTSPWQQSLAVPHALLLFCAAGSASASLHDLAFNLCVRVMIINTPLIKLVDLDAGSKEKRSRHQILIWFVSYLLIFVNWQKITTIYLKVFRVHSIFSHPHLNSTIGDSSDECIGVQAYQFILYLSFNWIVCSCEYFRNLLLWNSLTCLPMGFFGVPISDLKAIVSLGITPYQNCL